MWEVTVKAAAPAALRRKLRRPARSIACSSLGMTANHGNAGETGGGKKPTKTGVMALTGGKKNGSFRVGRGFGRKPRGRHQRLSPPLSAELQDTSLSLWGPFVAYIVRLKKT